MRRPLFACCAAAVLLLPVASGGRPAKAAEGPLAIQAASVGFNGKFKAGFWQPILVTLAAGAGGAAGRLELVVPDGDQTPVIYPHDGQREVHLAPGEELRLMLYARSGPVDAPFVLRLRSGDRVVWSAELPLREPALAATQELVVGLGQPLPLAEAVATIRRPPELALAVAEVPTTDALPEVWWGYEGVDQIVLTTGDGGILSSLSRAQQQALIDWVLQGGKLLLCAGQHGQELAAADSPWARLIPGQATEVVPLQERTGLETFTKIELPMDDPQFLRNRPHVTRLTAVRGEVLVGEDASALRPLVVHAAAGLGEIVFVGLDLEHPSLAAWQGKTRLLAALLNRDRNQRESTSRETRQSISHLGYEDLSGQLRTALDQFPGVTMVNFTTVSVLTLAYLLLIGPGDYLLLTRLGWPRHWTWFTFPAVAVGLLGLAWAIQRETHGSSVRLNQVEVIDVDLDQRQVRGTAWLQVYSPAAARYDLSLKLLAAGTVVQSPKGWLTWQGLPGSSLGGLGSRQPIAPPTDAYTAALPGTELRLSEVPIPIAASKGLAARWWGATPLDAGVRLTTDQFGLLSGEFRQPLAEELQDCLLAHGEKLYRLGRLPAGQRVVIDPQASLNLEWRLTLRRVEESKDVATPWDQASTDIPRIMQMMMFHEAARGRSYTGLTHRYQAHVDLSEHVRLGTAVFVGRASRPTVQLLRDDQPLAAPGDLATWTWYRLVLPVQAKTP